MSSFSDPLKMKRLEEEYEKRLRQCLSKESEWKKVESDYRSLDERLKTLPEKISHEITVPFGSLAFMKGKIVHTNEITVLLGENWFVERSAKQAKEIIQRRLNKCRQMLKDNQFEKEQILACIQYSSELKGGAGTGDGAEGLVEIVEEYDHETEKLWQEKHRINLRKLKEEEQRSANSSLLQNHPVLLVSENKNDQIEKSASAKCQQQQVTWKEPSSEPPKIVFQHSIESQLSSSICTSNKETRRQSFLEDSSSSPSSPYVLPAAVIQSPTDIYKQFGNFATNTKSILKQTDSPFSKFVKEFESSSKLSSQEQEEEEAASEKELPTANISLNTRRKLSLLGEVQEKSSPTISSGKNNDQEDSANRGQQATRPISKFKANRQNIRF